MISLLALIPVAVWLYLLAGRGMFWVMAERDNAGEDKKGGDPPAPPSWPSVVAVVPARNEADVIARSIGSLLAQDYPGDFRIVLVDDQSNDGTADAARKLDATGPPRNPRRFAAPGRLGRQGLGDEPGRRARPARRITSGSPTPISITPGKICASLWPAPRPAGSSSPR